ncbi:MAG: GNAT family N-acetyltransferase, partial [Acidobacteriota bacterium]|nr:GNAT family N-acetyltransferase [Acidobacteriota bacterium]
TPANIGSGIGRKLFAHALEKSASLNAKKLNIKSDPNAEGFYKKMGAKRIGDVVSEIEGNERILPLMQLIL